MSGVQYRKHFIPLESNPEVFTKLSHRLGVSENVRFVDIWTLDGVEHLPRPALALILVFPTSKEYEQRKSAEDAGRQEYTKTYKDGLMWLPQTINNACGLYAILHAVCNGDTRLSIRPESFLAKFITASKTRQPQDCAKFLEDSTELEAIYRDAAVQEDSVVPADAEAEIDFHYVCFIKSEDSRIYEMDGDRTGPIDKGVKLKPGEDTLSEASISVIKECIEQENNENLGFSLMALVETKLSDKAW